jgi:hypothetical protein
MCMPRDRRGIAISHVYGGEVSVLKVKPSRPKVTFVIEIVSWTVTPQFELLRVPRTVAPSWGERHAIESALVEPPAARAAPASRACARTPA